MIRARDVVGSFFYGILTGLIAFFVIYFAHELMVDFLSWMFEKTSEVDLYLSYVLTFAAIFLGGFGLIVIFVLLVAFGWWVTLKRFTRDFINWYFVLFFMSAIAPPGILVLYL